MLCSRVDWASYCVQYRIMQDFCWDPICDVYFLVLVFYFYFILMIRLADIERQCLVLRARMFEGAFSFRLMMKDTP